MTAEEFVRFVKAQGKADPAGDVELSEGLAMLRGNFRGVRLKRLRGQGAVIERGWFGKTMVEQCDLEKVVLSGLELREASASHCVIDDLISGADLIAIGSEVRSCRIGKLTSGHALLKSSVIADVHITEIMFRRGQFKQCKFERCVLAGRLEKCNFIDCKFTDVDMRQIEFDDSSFLGTELPRLPSTPSQFACPIAALSIIQRPLADRLPPASFERYAKMVQALSKASGVAVFNRAAFDDFSTGDADEILRCLFDNRVRQE